MKKEFKNLQEFYQYVIDKYSYKEHKGILQTPKELIKSKQGDCIELNNLMFDFIRNNYLGDDLKLYLLFFQTGEIDPLDKGKSIKYAHSVLLGTMDNHKMVPQDKFWIEASFENLKGLHLYRHWESHKNILKDIRTKYLNEYPNEDPNTLRIVGYKRNTKLKNDVDFFNSLNFK